MTRRSLHFQIVFFSAFFALAAFGCGTSDGTAVTPIDGATPVDLGARDLSAFDGGELPDGGTLDDLGPIDPDAATRWEVLPVGAGGWITGIDVHPSGTPRLARTDTYGAWRWEGTRWTQLVAADSMPASDVALDSAGGVHEIVSAPSDASRAYMAFRGYVFASDNQGTTWRRTGFARVAMNGNDAWRQSGDKMAVDPANRDVVFLGTNQDGLWRTRNGGDTWERVTSVPAGVDEAASGDTRGPGVSAIVFARGGTPVGGRTQTLYVSSAGNGVYRSTDGGETFAPIGGGTAPTSAWRSAIANDGTLYVVNPSGAFRFDGSAWSNVSPQSRGYYGVVVDPADSSRVYVFEDGGTAQRSTNGGANWTRLELARTAVGDIGWHAFTEESYMSVGEVIVDPTTPGGLFFAQGIGVWRADVTDTTSVIGWRAESRGIEQLVGNDVVHTPGGAPVVAAWDRAVFRTTPTGYPAAHGPTARFNSAWNLDWSPSTPGFLVANTSDHRFCCEGDGASLQGGFSTDDGRTWSVFLTQPGARASEFGFGNIAVAAENPDNIVWMPTSNRVPQVTLDRGRNWAPVSIPDVPGNVGSHFGLFLNRRVLVADKIAPATFYLAHSGADGGAGAGFYASTDGGRTFEQRFSGNLAPFDVFNAVLKVDPRRAGVLFFTPGPLDGMDGPLRRSNDGGRTWRDVAGVSRVYALGFGRPVDATAQSTLFIAGKVGGVYGLWRSTDDAETWRNIGTWPTGSLDNVRAIDGDKDVFGTAYLAFGGSGFAVGRLTR